MTHLDKNQIKNTLNLPKTSFPMKANLALREPDQLKHWEKIGLYERLRTYSKDQPIFTLLDGPPYANGHLHLGHAVNKILKDIILKAKTFEGFDAPFTPGWDCHGLPIELNVEKQLSLSGQQLTPTAFRQACRDYAASQIDIQRAEFMRLGVIADWDNPYRTMDFKFEANIVRSVGKIIAQKHIHQGYKPVHWCVACGSALAEAEVEYQDKESLALDVRFRVIDQSDFYNRCHLKAPTLSLTLSIPIWTTTPWTLPANQAVALNASVYYSIVACEQKEVLLIAEALLETVLQRYGIQQYQILGRVQGMALEFLLLQHPFYAKHVPVIMGEHVSVEAGTGAVHTAPAHGVDDFAVGQIYGLPLHSSVDDKGLFSEEVAIVGGLSVTAANARIIDALHAENTLLHHAPIRHSYPHCWRHKLPLIFRATAQWFVTLDKNKLRTSTLEAIQHIAWEPQWGAIRMRQMLEKRPDWCISRQRSWGVPLAVFVHHDTGLLHPSTLELIEKVALRIEKEGVEAWYTLNPESILGKDDAAHYVRVNDVLDVWFDSGVVHECVPKQHPVAPAPVDLCLEGSDQYRGWFQSLLLTGMAMHQNSPYRAVLTHGFVVDGDGRKMSKSVGNVIAPQEVINTLGADILRLWVASVDYRTEIHVSNEILARTAELYRRIRNTVRFLLANLHDFLPEEHLLSGDELLSLDHWMLLQTKALQHELIALYMQFQFHSVVHKLHDFCTHMLGGFYLDIIKDRQYTMLPNSRGRRSAQTVLFHILHALIRWVAPILSFTAEEAWQYFTVMSVQKTDSVFLSRWYDEWPALDEQQPIDWETIRFVRDAVNKEVEKQRDLGKIGSGLEAEVYLYHDGVFHEQLCVLQSELHFVFISAEVHLVEKEAVEAIPCVETTVPGLMLAVLPTPHPKCERCWHRSPYVGKDHHYPTLCTRCVMNVFGEGEVRQFA